MMNNYRLNRFYRLFLNLGNQDNLWLRFRDESFGNARSDFSKQLKTNV